MVKHARSLWSTVCCASLLTWAGPSPGASKPPPKPAKPTATTVQPPLPPAAARADGAGLLKLLAASLDAPNDSSLRAQIDDSVERIRQQVVHQVVIADFKNLSGDVELHARFTEGLFSYLNGHAPPDVKIVDRELGESLKAKGVALPVLASIGGSVYSLRIETQQEVGANVKVASRKVYNPARMDIAYRLNTLDSNLPHWQEQKEAREEALVPSLLSGVRRWQSAGEPAGASSTPAPAVSGSIILPQYQSPAPATAPSHTTETLMERADVLSGVLGALAHTGEVQQIQSRVSAERSRLIDELNRQPEFIEEPIYAPSRSAAKTAVWVIHIRILSPDGLEVLQDQELSETDAAFAQYTAQGEEASPVPSGLPTDLDMRERVIAKLVERAGRWIIDTVGSGGLTYYESAVNSLSQRDTAAAVEQFMSFLASGSAALYPDNAERAVTYLSGEAGLSEDGAMQLAERLSSLWGVRRAALLVLASDPPGATVTIDGVIQSQVTPCRLRVNLECASAREVEFRMEREGYAPWQQPYTVRAGTACTVGPAVLTALPIKVNLAITAEPWSQAPGEWKFVLIEEVNLDSRCIAALDPDIDVTKYRLGSLFHQDYLKGIAIGGQSRGELAFRPGLIDDQDPSRSVIPVYSGELTLAPGSHALALKGAVVTVKSWFNNWGGLRVEKTEAACEFSEEINAVPGPPRQIRYAAGAPGVVQVADSASSVRGTIGLSVAPLPDDAKRTAGVTAGVLVAEVDRAGESAKAGITPGDILLEYAGVEMTSPAQAATAIRSTPPGTAVRLRVLHEGKPLLMYLLVGNSPGA